MDAASLVKCQQLVDALVSHELSWPFLEPVDPVAMNLPTYFEMIKHPMDLSTIQKKLTRHEYDMPSQVRDDLLLMCQNAIAFNEQDTSEASVCSMSRQLLDYGLEQWDLLFGENQLVDCKVLLEKTMRRAFLKRVHDADLMRKWRKHSFVASFNRQKIQQRRQAAQEAAEAAVAAAAAAVATATAAAQAMTA